MTKYSPGWLIGIFERTQTKFLWQTRKLYRLHPNIFYTIFFLKSVVLLIVFEKIYGMSEGLDLALFSFSKLLRVFQGFIVILLLFGFFKKFSPKWNVFIFLIIAWVVADQPNSDFLRRFIFFILPFIFYAFIALFKSLSRHWKLLLTLIACIGFNSLHQSHFDLSVSGILTQTVARQALPFIFFIFQTDQILWKDIVKLSFPTIFLNAIPLLKSEMSINETTKTTLVRGLYGLCFVEISEIILLLLMKIPLVDSVFFGGAHIYLRVYFVSYIFGSTPIFLMRVFGYRLRQDDFNYALLATTPVERWRQWNTYYNRFFIRTLFLPLGKIFKGQIFIPLFFVFFALFAIMGGILSSTYNLHNGASFFFLHFLTVYLFMKWNIQFPLNKKSAWIGVVITWLLMSIIHWWGGNTDAYRL
jgi:hypothetical protein